MSTRFELRCLGSPSLLGSDGEPIRFKTRKHFGLLVYLAIEGHQSHRRQRLAELLWPRVSEADARHSVATAISMFRHRLGPRSIVADRDNVRLTLPQLTLDLTRLLGGQILGDEVTPPLEIANFLEDFDLSDAPEFMLWRSRQQARLFPAIRDGLLQLIDRCRRTGNFRQIEVLADRLLDIDHLSEDGIRAKMEARAFDGDRLSALRIYEEWKTVLAHELSATPSAQVQGIALRLRRRGWERTESVEIPNVPTDHWRGHRFVGRSREYRAAYEAWEQTSQGKAQHLLLLGDSGVGKTTIADRLITAAGLEGAATIRIQCYEVDRGLPYAALTGLVRGLLERPGVSGTPPEALANLSICVPEIRQRYADLPAPGTSDGEGTRIQLAEAMHELLMAVVEERPVILVVDDLHMADDVSVAVLHMVLRRLGERPVMMLFTARPTELERSPSARRVREESEALNVHSVGVPPMTETESLELLQAMLEESERQPNPAEQKAFIAAAAGYPMVLELFVRDWMANGKSAIPLVLGAMTPDMSLARIAEDSYKALVERMIRELPPDVRSVLNLAAILGGRLNDFEMYGLVDLTLASTMNGMTQLTDLRFLRDNGRELGFRNELIRAQVYASVPSTMRKALHARVLERLKSQESESPPSGLELAWHSFRAGKIKDGQDYLLSGAREAMDNGASCEAELALESGLTSFARPEKDDVCILLSETLQDQGRWAESKAVLAMIGEDCSETIGWMRKVHQALAEWSTGATRYSRISEEIRKLAPAASQDKVPHLRYRTLLTAKLIVSTTHDQVSAREWLSIVRAASHSESEYSERTKLEHFALAFSYFADERIEAAETAGTLRLAENRIPTAVHATQQFAEYMTIGSQRTTEGDYVGGLPSFTHAYETGLHLTNRALASRAAGNLSLCHYRLGNNEESVRWATIGLEHLKADEDLLGFKLIHLAAWGKALRGDEVGSLQMLDRLKGEHRYKELPWSRQAALLLTSDVLHVLGKRKEALEAAAAATSGELRKLQTKAYAGAWARIQARLGLSEGRFSDRLANIDGASERLASLDLIDSAEVGCAKIVLKKKLSTDFSSDAKQVELALKRLPAAVPRILELLGFGPALE